MRCSVSLFALSLSLTTPVVLAQPPATSTDMIAPTEAPPGIRVVPAQGAAVQPAPQVPPPPPNGAPWSPQGQPGVVMGQPGVVMMQPQPGYIYGQPLMYGAPMLAMNPLVPYEGGPVPPGARVVTRARTGLIAGGAAMFGSVWLTSLIVSTAGSSSREEGLGWLAVPLIGPLIAGGQMRGVSSTGWTVLILDTLLQSGGLAMMIYGITHPAQFLSYDAPRPLGSRQGLRWAIAPGHAAGPGATFALRF